MAHVSFRRQKADVAESDEAPKALGRAEGGTEWHVNCGMRYESASKAIIGELSCHAIV